MIRPQAGMVSSVYVWSRPTYGPNHVGWTKILKDVNAFVFRTRRGKGEG